MSKRESPFIDWMLGGKKKKLDDGPPLDASEVGDSLTPDDFDSSFSDLLRQVDFSADPFDEESSTAEESDSPRGDTEETRVGDVSTSERDVTNKKETGRADPTNDATVPRITDLTASQLALVENIDFAVNPFDYGEVDLLRTAMQISEVGDDFDVSLSDKAGTSGEADGRRSSVGAPADDGAKPDPSVGETAPSNDVANPDAETDNLRPSSNQVVVDGGLDWGEIQTFDLMDGLDEDLLETSFGGLLDQVRKTRTNSWSGSILI